MQKKFSEKMPKKRNVPNQAHLDTLLASYNNEDDYYYAYYLGMSHKLQYPTLYGGGHINGGETRVFHQQWDNEMHDILLKSVEERYALG